MSEKANQKSYRKSPKSGERDGDGRRIPRVEKEIREVVGQYLLRGFRGNLPGLVSVTRVIASKDLKNAKILITVMAKKKTVVSAGAEPDDSLKKATLVELKAHAHEVQSEVNRQLKMKHCPKLNFYYDEGVEHALKIETLLQDINQKTQQKIKSPS